MTDYEQLPLLAPDGEADFVLSDFDLDSLVDIAEQLEDLPEALEEHELHAELPDGYGSMSEEQWQDWEELRLGGDKKYGLNMTRFYPEHDDDMYQKCMLVSPRSKVRPIWALISASQESFLKAPAWSVLPDKKHYIRYIRRAQIATDGMFTEYYLHREVIRLRLVQDEAYRKAKIEEFKLHRMHNLPVVAQVAGLLAPRQVHHKNGITDDCRMENLDLVDQVANLSQRETVGASGIKGVTLRKDNRFEARLKLKVNGCEKSWSLGVYENRAHAALARCFACFAKPGWLRAGDYTPSPSEEVYWKAAQEMIESGYSTVLGFEEAGLSPRLTELLEMVRKVKQKPRAKELKVNLRDDSALVR